MKKAADGSSDQSEAPLDPSVVFFGIMAKISHNASITSIHSWGVPLRQSCALYTNYILNLNKFQLQFQN